MLRELYIKNVAVIDEATIEFKKGFNVLTGETGAGKSILIDSINMVIGSRSSKEIVRTGTDKAVVNACFEVNSEALLNKLDEMGIDCDENEVILSRQISSEGKSVCRCNGMVLPLASVREIGEFLVDIHGQHDNQKIMNKNKHIEFLDDYGKYTDIKNEYKEFFAEYRRIVKEIEALNCDKEERIRKLDLLSFQIDEIEEARLKEGEDEALEERRTFLVNAEKIASGVELAYEELYGSEYQKPAFDLVMNAIKELDNIKEYDNSLGEYASRLEGAMAEIEDITSELKDFMDKTEYSQAEFDEIEGRLDVINNLKRKYGNTISQIEQYLEKIKIEWEKYSQGEENLEILTAEKNKAEEKMRKASEKLSKERKRFAKELEEKISKELAELDMPNVKFVVSVEETEHNSLGKDKVEFLISANVGEEPKPMNKIASGGELSRIMLAIKSVMTDSESFETMIFDEIDTGVSGRAAQKIAEKMAGFSKNSQVFAVTHLSQIAAMADTHLFIHKESRDQKTYTSVETLDMQGRINELGRIIGGVSVTDTTLQSAKEMLEMASNIKAGGR